MRRRSGPSRTPSTTSTSTRPRASRATGGDGRVHPADALAERLGLPVRDLRPARAGAHPQQLAPRAPRRRARPQRAARVPRRRRRQPRHLRGAVRAPSRRRRGRPVRPPRRDRLARPGSRGSPSRLDLGSYLLLGEGEAQRGGRRRPSLLASAFEAVAGAIYLDLGWEARATGSRRWRGPELVGRRADHAAQEPQEPAPGAHPAA